MFRRVFDIFIRFDALSNFVMFYPLKAATIKTCRNEILNDYVVNVTRSEHILSNNGTQVAGKN
jgi:hypothetical protein